MINVIVLKVCDNILLWLTAFVEIFRSGHLDESWPENPSSVQEETGPREVDSRSDGSHVVVTSSVGGIPTPERIDRWGALLMKN